MLEFGITAAAMYEEETRALVVGVALAAAGEELHHYFWGEWYYDSLYYQFENLKFMFALIITYIKWDQFETLPNWSSPTK